MVFTLKFIFFLAVLTNIGSCTNDKIFEPNTSNLPSIMDGSADPIKKLTSPNTNVTINNLPKIENLVVNENGQQLSFNIIDDNESVGITLYGKKPGDTDYVNISELFTGDIGTHIAVGANKTITSIELNEYNEMALRVTDLEDFKLDILKTVSENRIQHDIQQLSGIRHYALPQLLNQTRRYIKKEFEKYQLDAALIHSFSWNSISAANVVGHHKGNINDNGTYIICAHFDSVRNTPGADDNASGTAGILEAMRILSQYEFKNSIAFIGFDLEEQGLIGSKEYVNELNTNHDILGVINFEMIGYPCRSAICQDLPLSDTSIYNIALPEFTALRTKFDAIGNEYVPKLKITSVEADNDPNFRRSDHAPFWSANISALFITDGANFRNPHYHQTSDTPETLDYNFTKNIVATTVLTVMDLAGINRTTSVHITL
ncbi:M28 family peptidase [Croceitalea rosinachiae]|uniref:M28 family peptidase n=1 Tax=Croceitalea rosinachiae TaxID=3075596 RepID=A0ABU3AE97_9FLAO|nr:M28 family peptidase [Croceitalea sp. F388]MDT0608514.1 M28 family peptidase [Croceitalea sp. F388]